MIEKITQAVQACKGNERQIGEVVLMIAEADERAAEVIAADLDNPEMSFDKCFEALRKYAKEHQKGGFWGCVCNSYDPENPVIKVVADFYGLALSQSAPKSQAIGQKQQAAPQSDELDLMSLL